MAIAFRAAGTFAEANSTSSGSVGLPAGLANDDILVLQVIARGTASTIATPSGYTQAATVNRTSSHRMSVFYKVITNAAGEAAPTVTQSVSGLIAARLTAWSGCSTTTPLDVTTVTGDEDGADTTGTAPSISPVSQGAMAIWCFSTPDDNSLGSATQGTTAYASQSTLGSDGSIALVYELQTNAAPTGTTSMTQGANGPDNWNFIVLALRPAAVAAANPSRDIGYDSLLYAVEAAFGASPFSATPTWTDISAYVRASSGIQVTRGRSSEFSDTQPGMMTLVLDNKTRLFDPDYSSGTYYGQLVPQVRIRLRCRFSSVNYPIFDGYVTGWPQEYSYPREATVTITAVDLFGRLNTRKTPPTLLALEVMADHPVAYFPMLEDSLPVCADLSGSGWAASYSSDVEVIDSFLPGESSQKAKRLVETDFVTNDFMIASGVDIDLAYTVEAWFRVDGAVDDEFVLLLGDVATLAFGVQSTNALVSISADAEADSATGTYVTAGITAVLQDATHATAATISQALPRGFTYHVATVLNSTHTTWTLYVNGAVWRIEDVSAFTFEGGSDTTGISVVTDEVCDVSFAHFAVFDEELSSSRITAHLLAGRTGGYLDLSSTRLQSLADYAGLVDASLYSATDIGANTFLGSGPPSGSVLSAMQDVIRTEQGRIFASSSGILTAQGRAADMGELTVNSTSQATISDSGVYAYAQVPIDSAMVDLMRNAIYVSAAGATVVVSDSDSVAQYDELEESLSVILDDGTAAANLGRSRLRRFADPTSRINQVRLVPHGASDVRYPLCLGVELGWRLTVTRTPQALGSAISKTVTVEGITHNFTPSHLETTLYLVPAQDTYSAHPWLRLGDSTYGKVGAAFGNALPY